ncbi:peptidyl-prolyl cis-trans isomerase [Microbulbifer agarilyticus]|uniref:peptidylprolyl isomerase n=1 Tax=Microbulbifer agarilyticus TaxID=260552 RepID=UPI001CD434CE|nr:peptidylprolyl isomerase [Microbulbifer agarilyticus]MCA0895012.1 peptidyl-prolyl cis-trans isomerase [Microbulbifer agarilyticus]
MIKKIIKEPLLHFAVIGGLVFALYATAPGDTGIGEKQIAVSAQDIERHVALFERKWQRLPTANELSALLENDIREEIFYREALALGLDRDDALVRRRLAQKMEFISADIAQMRRPSDEELQTYLDSNPTAFTAQARYHFEQVYLDPARRYSNADVLELLGQLRAAASVDHRQFSDPIMLPAQLVDTDTQTIDRTFGEGFAATLANAPTGQWHGPIQSSYGMHLVRIASHQPGRNAKLAEVRDAVEGAWRQAERKQAQAALYQSLRAQYQVLVPEAAHHLLAPVEVQVEVAAE